jgi:hypothetical protein
MTTSVTSKGAAVSSSNLQFKVSPTTVTIRGDIHQSDGTVVLQDICAGGTTTPFQLPPGQYYYEFDYVGTAVAAFTISLPGASADCDPSSIDPALGTVDQITDFSIG